MGYKAVVFFRDGADDNHLYRPGEEFPRPGLKVTEARLQELSTEANRRGTPMIRKTDPAPDPVQHDEKPETPVKPKRTRKRG